MNKLLQLRLNTHCNHNVINKHFNSIEIYGIKLPHLKNIILMSERGEEGMYNWSEFLAHAFSVSDDVLNEQLNGLHPDDVINIQIYMGIPGFQKA